MDEFLAGLICGLVIMGGVSVSTYTSPAKIKQIEQNIEQNMQKQAISHGAARYEVDTNGVVSFKWNK